MGSAEQQAKEKGIEVRVGKFPFAALGRAMAVNETDGFFKVVADKKTHEVLGVHIVGPEATDLISEGALALEMHAFLEDIGLTIHPHPTLGEGMMEASLNALGQAIHIMNREVQPGLPTSTSTAWRRASAVPESSVNRCARPSSTATRTSSLIPPMMAVAIAGGSLGSFGFSFRPDRRYGADCPRTSSAPSAAP